MKQSNVIDISALRGRGVQDSLRSAFSKRQSILVFPAGMPAALTFSHQMSRTGRRIVGASSLAHDPECGHYPEFARLPWVLDENFASALALVILTYDVDEIYTPHPIVWECLAALLPALPTGIYLHPQDWDGEFAAYDRQRQMAESFAVTKWHAVSEEVRRPLAVSQIAGLIRLFDATPGQCSHTKLEAVIALFRDLPLGDIVEIGTLFGRTALMFAFLARHYANGNVLCVDPWLNAELKQGTKEVDLHSSKISTEAIFQAFTANLSPWCGTVNYIRRPSIEGAVVYKAGRSIHTPEFGSTRYTGDIALLHLDGNHAFESIRNDLRAWASRVRPGGWIIFDDYRWPFGDGPQRVADEFCISYKKFWSTAFEVGGALFVRLHTKIDLGR